ncbi:MAG: hypothetical protein IID48_04860 [Proteobacteria bacterium]|nr:hypothetical protein [Pseudomonadota bacterium]
MNLSVLHISDLHRDPANPIRNQVLLDSLEIEAIRMFQRDNEMRNIVLTDPEARDKAPRHFFNRALREVREVAGRAD